MRNRSFVDCFMLMGSVLSLSKSGEKLPDMGRPILGENPTKVNVSLQIHEFKITDLKHMVLETDLILNQKWQDSRLGPNPKTRKLAVSGQLWKPKITNINGNKLYCCNEDDTVFWRGFGEEGNILLSEKFKLSVSCTQFLQKFPFDKQFCEFKFGSYRFPMEEVFLLWDFIPAELMTSLNLNEFSIVNVITYHQVDIRISGNFSTAVFQVVLERNYTHYIHCLILPCIVLMLLNYLTLFFDLTKCNTRLMINFVIFGLFLYYYLEAICQFQSVPYLKALDIFLLICETFSLITLLETIFIDKVFTFEHLYHSRKIFGREHSEIVHWLEVAMKISYPVLFIFSLIVFGVLYVE